MRRNHVVGWLTLAPVIILCLPAFAIPFANALVAVNPGNIVSFHRVLFAIPPGLALIVLVENFLSRRTALISTRSGLTISLFFWVLVLATVIVPPGRFAYNRLYNLFAVAPADLSLAALTAPSSSNDQHPTPTRPPLVVPRSIGFVLETRGFSNFIPYYRGERHIAPPRIPAKELNDLTYVIRFNKERQSPITVWIPPATDLWTPVSLTALISNHWIPQQVALDRAGKQEVDRTLDQ